MAAGVAPGPNRASAASRMAASYPRIAASIKIQRERSPITATLTIAQRMNPTPGATSTNVCISKSPALATCENRSMKTVAIIGASSNRGKFGNKALRAFEHQGFTVIPINPTEAEVEGHKAYASVLDVPGPIDMATVYVPPRAGVKVMEEIAQKGIAEVWLNPGADGRDVVERARALGLKIIQACSIIAIGESPSMF